jgi:nucleoside-triphosphatase THEP1
LELSECTQRQPLGEDVSELRGGQDAENANVTNGDTLADEVKLELYVFLALMLHEVGEEVDRADVVVIDEGGALEGAVELLKKLAEPRDLDHVVGHNAVLDLSVGARDDGLPLRGLGDEVGA